MSSLPDRDASGLNAQGNSEATPTGTGNLKHAHSDHSTTASLTDLRDSSVKRLKISKVSSVPLLLLHNADTLVYIDPLPDTLTSTSRAQTVPHRVRSKTLLDTESPYFAQLFSLRYQTRIRKSRGFEKNLPAGIKYVLDLTPATMDDEALIMLAEVTCPMAIRTWALRKTEWKLPASCVGGEDDMEPIERPAPTTLPGFGADNETANKIDDDLRRVQRWMDEGVMGPPTTHPNVPLPFEYSQARHREAIEMVLRVLEGLSVTLDTPCKLWTFFAVAKMMGIVTNPSVREYIIGWFNEGNNASFIEVHPEITYRVACSIKSAAFCQFSFANLVGDAALLHFMRSANIRPTTTWRASYEYSRIHDMLEDIDIQRVEYASKSFADQMIRNFLFLTGVEMSWLSDIPEFSKITQHASKYPEDIGVVNELITNLKIFVRTAIYRLLQRTKFPLRSFDTLPPDGTVDPPNVFIGHGIVIGLMSRRFWASIEVCQLPLLSLEAHWYSRIRRGAHTNTIAALAPGLLSFQQQEDALIKSLPGRLLSEHVFRFNERVSHQTASAGTSQRMELTLNLRNQNAPSWTPGDAPSSSTTNPSANASEASPSIPTETILPYRPARQASDSELQDLTGTDPKRVLPATEDKIFDLSVFRSTVQAYLSGYADAVIFPRTHTHVPRYATDVMTSLTDEEWKYLPLWAGGNDDGSGGVFADHDIPTMSAGGFSAPGPAVHTDSITSTETSFSNIGLSESQSTVHAASHHATYSHVSYAVSMASNAVEQQRANDTMTTGHDALPMNTGDARSTGANPAERSHQSSELPDTEVDMSASDTEYDLLRDFTV